MAAEATTGSDLLIRRRSFRSFMSEVFGPLLQVFLFVIGSAIVLGGIVLLFAVMLRGTREDIDLVQGTITILPQVMIDGLVRGFLYATIALGYTMVYGVLEFINFAHGEIFMVGAFVGAFFSAALASSGMLTTLSPILFVIAAVLLGMAVSGVLAMSIERVAYRPLRNAPRLVPLISAIGVSLVLQDVMRMIAVNTGLGFNAQFRTPDLGQPLVLAQMPIADERTIPVSIDSRSLIFIVVAILMLIGLNYPVNTLKNVVFPAPLGPITLTILPASMVSDTSLTAVSPPNCLVICFCFQERHNQTSQPSALCAVSVTDAACCVSGVGSGSSWCNS